MQNSLCRCRVGRRRTTRWRGSSSRPSKCWGYVCRHVGRGVPKDRLLVQQRLLVRHQGHPQVRGNRPAPLLPPQENEQLREAAQHVWLPQDETQPLQKHLQTRILPDEQGVRHHSCRDLLPLIRRKPKLNDKENDDNEEVEEVKQEPVVRMLRQPLAVKQEEPTMANEKWANLSN